MNPTPGGRRLRPHDARGLTNSVQWAVLFPLVMLCTLGIIQAGIWIHGHNVASAATDVAVDISRGDAATSGDGDASAAARRVAEAGGLTDVNLEVDRGQAEVTVTLTARIPMFIDVAGLGLIREVGHAPVERVSTP